MKNLRGDLARQLCSRCDDLSRNVERGTYDRADLKELGSINVRDHIVGNDARLSEVMGVSGKTIAATYSGRTRPKLTNFLKMLHGAKRILESEIQEPGSQDVGFEDLIGTDSADLEVVKPDVSDPQIVRDNLFLNRVQIIRYSNVIISALQEVLEYDGARHHNYPPPSLRLDDPSYLAEVRSLVLELQKLNSLLENMVRSDALAAKQAATNLGKHLDEFLGSYAKSLGKARRV